MISMIQGIKKNIGQTVDGWKALNLFSERLKMMVEKYNVGIMSATQLNKEGDTSGSGAIPNAVDIWAKLRIATEKEIEKLSHQIYPDTPLMTVTYSLRRGFVRGYMEAIKTLEMINPIRIDQVFSPGLVLTDLDSHWKSNPRNYEIEDWASM